MMTQQVKQFSYFQDFINSEEFFHTYLDINFTKQYTYDEGALLLGQALEKYSDLKVLNLNLNCCYIGSYGLSRLINNLTKCTKLWNLKFDLRGNHFKSDGLLDLGIGLENITHLQILDLNIGYNSFDQQGVNALIESLSKCKNLWKFTLEIKKHFGCLLSPLKLAIGLSKFPELKILVLNIQCYSNPRIAMKLNIKLFKTKKLIQKEINFYDLFY
ncbi:hypothetical protein ABPG74_020192 [Tetrahymena malaccensis]